MNTTTTGMAQAINVYFKWNRVDVEVATCPQGNCKQHLNFEPVDTATIELYKNIFPEDTGAYFDLPDTSHGRWMCWMWNVGCMLDK
jgi:hypothetical protein